MLLDKEDDVMVAGRPLLRLRYHIEADVLVRSVVVCGQTMSVITTVALRPINGVDPGEVCFRARLVSLHRVRELSRLLDAWRLLQTIEKMSAAPHVSFAEFFLRSMRDQSAVSVTFHPDDPTIPRAVLRVGPIHVGWSLPPVFVRQLEQYFYERSCADD